MSDLILYGQNPQRSIWRAPLLILLIDFTKYFEIWSMNEVYCVCPLIQWLLKKKYNCQIHHKSRYMLMNYKSLKGHNFLRPKGTTDEVKRPKGPPTWSQGSEGPYTSSLIHICWVNLIKGEEFTNVINRAEGVVNIANAYSVQEERKLNSGLWQEIWPTHPITVTTGIN